MRVFLLLLPLFLITFSVHGEPEVLPGVKSDVKKPAHSLRILCVSSLKESEELILASQDENGAWHEFSTIKLRSSFITDWLPAATGQLHLAVKTGDAFTSKCRFTYPEGASKPVVVLLPDVQKQVYLADVIDPSKLQFAKGSTLLINYSPLPGAVMLGTQRLTVKPGERIVSKPVAEANGMFRMLVAYADKSQKIIPCYDRYLPVNPEARDFLLLFPDPANGLRVYDLAEFGPFE
jgi:hypothetical protein